MDPFTEINPEQEKLLQDLSNDIYHQFTEIVKNSMNLKTSKKLWAQGKIFTGKQGFDLKLIHELGNISTTLNYIKKILKSEKEIKLIYPPKQSFLSKFFANQDSPEEISLKNIKNEP